MTDTLIGGDGYTAEYGGAGPYDIDVPMLYVGDLGGVLHSINLAGSDDTSRFIQDAPLDGSPIISTPALLVNGNGSDIAGSASPPRGAVSGNNAGGALYLTTQSGSIWESEAFPFIENSVTNLQNVTVPARNVDWEFGGPGGYSSVAASSFNVDNFNFTPYTASDGYFGGVNGSSSSVDTSEWVYASGDDGYTYGFTADNTSLGNGGTTGFNPGGQIPPGNTPPNTTVPLNRTIVTAVFTKNPLASVTSGVYFNSDNGGKTGNASGRPPNNPAFEWGQTAYIVFYGLDDPMLTATTAPASYYPKALTLTFTIQPVGTAANGTNIFTKAIDLQATGAAVTIAQVGLCLPAWQRQRRRPADTGCEDPDYQYKRAG